MCPGGASASRDHVVRVERAERRGQRLVRGAEQLERLARRPRPHGVDQLGRRGDRVELGQDAGGVAGEAATATDSDQNWFVVIRWAITSCTDHPSHLVGRRPLLVVEPVEQRGQAGPLADQRDGWVVDQPRHLQQRLAVVARTDLHPWTLSLGCRGAWGLGSGGEAVVLVRSDRPHRRAGEPERQQREHHGEAGDDDRDHRGPVRGLRRRRRRDRRRPGTRGIDRRRGRPVGRRARWSTSSTGAGCSGLGFPLDGASIQATS